MLTVLNESELPSDEIKASLINIIGLIDKFVIKKVFY